MNVHPITRSIKLYIGLFRMSQLFSNRKGPGSLVSVEQLLSLERTGWDVVNFLPNGFS